MAASAAGYTDDLITISQAGFASGPKVGVIENRVTIGGNLGAANARAAVFTIAKKSMCLGAYIRVVTPSSNATTVSVGIVTSEDGSATTLAGEMATNGAAGTVVNTNLITTTAQVSLYPVLIAADSQVVIEASADVGAAGVLDVGLILVDVAG